MKAYEHIINEETGEETLNEVEVTVTVEESSEPTQLDTIEAQVTYTAMMTDTLLEV